MRRLSTAERPYGFALRLGEDAPELGGVVRLGEDLVAELARVAGARDPRGHLADVHLVGEEAEVAEALDVLVDEVGEHLARARPLELDVRELLGDWLDRDVQAGHDLEHVVEVGVERGDHPGARVRELEDRAVADHLPILVAEGRVADLTDLQPEHVVGADPVGRGERVRAAEVPFAQRRLVPHADALADGVVLGDRVAELGRPVPVLPLHELGAELALDAVKAVRMVPASVLTSPPSPWAPA